eukprot:500189_1
MSCLTFLFAALLYIAGIVASKEDSISHDSISKSIYQALEYKYKPRYLQAKPQHNNSVAVNAEKKTICITTRDGICLSTNFWTPGDIHRPPYDVLYAKTPYGKGSLDDTGDVAMEQGWVFLGQDCRGRYESKGKYSFWRTSGNVAIIGVSANALAQYVK